MAEVTDAGGTPVPGASVTFQVLQGALDSGSASPVTAITNGQGIAQTTWTLGASVTSSFLGQQALRASLTNYPNATTTTFGANVVAGPPIQLAFTVQPPSGSAGNTISPSVRVTIEDAFGNPTQASEDVTITLDGGTAGAHLAGTTVQSTTSGSYPGVAVFFDLSVDTAGTAYTFSATAPGLAPAGSMPFNVTAATTPRWITQTPLATARGFAAAAVGPDGRIYVAGGASASASFEAYDPVTGADTALADMPIARRLFPLVAGSDDRIYAIGGEDASGTNVSRVDAYDTGTNAWTQVADLAGADSEFGAVTGADGRIYVFNGSGDRASWPIRPRRTPGAAWEARRGSAR